MAHIHEKNDFTVSVFIVHERKVLFVHHKELDRWLPVGGHVELHENPEEAALREVREESSLDVELVGERPPLRSEVGYFPLLVPRFLDIHVIKEPHWHIGMVYFARVKSGRVSLNPEEHHDIRWLSEKDLEDPALGLSVPLVHYARQAIQALG